MFEIPAGGRQTNETTPASGQSGTVLELGPSGVV